MQAGEELSAHEVRPGAGHECHLGAQHLCRQARIQRSPARVDASGQMVVGDVADGEDAHRAHGPTLSGCAAPPRTVPPSMSISQ